MFGLSALQWVAADVIQATRSAAVRVGCRARGQVHQGVAAPAGRPHHLLHFLFYARRHGGVADVGIYLHQEVTPDDHGLQFRVIDVGGNNGATFGDFIAHEFGGDFSRQRSAKIMPGMLACEQLYQVITTLIFANGNVFHFRLIMPRRA